MYQPLNTLPDLVLDSEFLGHFMPLIDHLTARQNLYRRLYNKHPHLA